MLTVRLASTYADATAGPATRSVSALTIIPVLLVVHAKDSFIAMLGVGFPLGIGGTTFAIGIPLVNSWFPPAHRGFALGLFGMGMGGVALSGYFTPRIAEHGENLPFIVGAVAFAVFALLALVLITDCPDRPVPTSPLATRLGQAGRLRVTWELSFLYVIGFDGIVAFGVYLPTYLKTWYELDPTDAGIKAAGFARSRSTSLSPAASTRMAACATSGRNGRRGARPADTPPVRLP